MKPTPGIRFRHALKTSHPLPIVGTINAYTALLAQQAGFQALYLSGAGVANASYGLPDLGMTNLADVLEDTRRITQAVDLPLLVDIDTGWGNAFTIARTIREMIRAGAAAVHLEDQVQAKRCGHRPGKKIVETNEMINRIKAAVDAKTESSFMIMARTDALNIEGIDATLERVHHYIQAGADMIFLEGVQELAQYQLFTQHCSVPLLANITEFGLTPLFTQKELASVGVSMALYPLTAFRAMGAAAMDVYRTLFREETQRNLIAKMQTRESLYDVLNYRHYEAQLDAYLGNQDNEEDE